MRHLTLAVIVLAVAAAASAQERTLFSSPIETGGFGGPVVKFTTVNDQGGVMVGGRGGWVLNHSLLIGGGGYGLVTDVDAPGSVLPGAGPLDIELGYGGVEVEYRIRPKALGHIGFNALIGGGSTRYVRDVGPVTESREPVSDSDTIFVFEPTINAELNVTRWFHMNAGVSYRVVTGVQIEGLKNSALSGVAGSINLKFGKF